MVSILGKLKFIDPTLPTCTWEIKSGLVLFLFNSWAYIWCSVMKDYNLLLLCSLHFLKFSLFDSLVWEQMCPESSKSMHAIHFRVPEKSGCEPTQWCWPQAVGLGRSQTNGYSKQKYSYRYVIISVIELVWLGHCITAIVYFNSL